ncbi:alpha/beta fold hydrolase [Merismopedia glauca]|uniref:Alpha/beta hydrolase n=1 Tax=Merismopedia glauca CCAP 1448/3 TaxID=1296344 RepID=A0A2T1C5K9_9CYAN|nr:alpha/beta hydrolase [Merismopedia glauca]PSB03427.1 alpha/beta hydrolase [Merismopedia glauca CCAP 1448/3]
MLNYEIKGKGLPILCLHGHPGSSQSMSVFTNHLSRKFQTIAPDLRGYGKSKTNGKFVMSDHLTDLEDLLDRLQINNCLVLGWSLGGILAMELALKRPEKVKGLILIATAARPWSDHPRITWQDNLYTGIAGILNRLFPAWEWNIKTFGKRSLFRHLIQQHHATAYRYIAQDAVAAYLKTSSYATNALNTAIKAGYNRLSDISAIQCPCLVLAGECDRHIIAASSQHTAQALPNSQWCCYPNTAHLFPWEVPDLVLSDIDNWLINQGF